MYRQKNLLHLINSTCIVSRMWRSSRCIRINYYRWYDDIIYFEHFQTWILSNHLSSIELASIFSDATINSNQLTITATRISIPKRHYLSHDCYFCTRGYDVNTALKTASNVRHKDDNPVPLKVYRAIKCYWQEEIVYVFLSHNKWFVFPWNRQHDLNYPLS